MYIIINEAVSLWLNELNQRLVKSDFFEDELENTCRENITTPTIFNYECKFR